MDKEALSILVNELDDSTTGEAYCSLGGQVIPAKIASAIGEGLNLNPWSALVIGRTRPQRQATSNPGGVIAEEERRKKELTKMLVEVYVAGGKDKMGDAAKVLNAQAINLDVNEVRFEAIGLSVLV